ncbi:MAG: penicillin acylase family protein [Deltaproteobacteria bacterium]|nr:MAG: penicillin acylase family protein [Deltaproteobacteria bacterium]
MLKHLFRFVMGRRLPTHQGTIRVAGPDAAIRIRRDRYGVPYIDAETDHDAWFGLGFCHGQDRGGQLEIVKRLLDGTLSAVAGPDTVPLDRLSRRLGLGRAAAAQFAAADADIRAQLDAYAAGINAGVRRGARKLPHELGLLRCAPTPWTGADVQGFCVVITFALAANWDIELVRLRILREHGPEALMALDPTTPEWLHATTPPLERAQGAVDRLAADVSAFTRLMGLGGGSNAWVVAAEKTATGRPILANDPHLMPSAPAQWYLASLRTPRWAAAGATFAGAASLVVGHNGHAAWGVTAAHIDVADFFVEEIGPDGASVREGDAFVPCEVRREEIAVKGKPPVVEEILETPRGPIVSPAFGEDGVALSLSASWLQSRPYRGLLGIHHVRSPDDLRAAFTQSSASNTTVAYADVDGHIAWLAAADVPLRRFGSGTVPLPGWDPRVGWDGFAPPETLPFVADPKAGFIATANNAPRANPEEGPFLGLDWLDGYRATTIGTALAARDDWDVAATLALQLDTTSRPWRELRDLLLMLPEADADAARGLALLRAWDGDLGPDTIGGTVFVHLLSELARRIVERHAPRVAAAALGEGATAFLPHNLLVTRRTSHLVRILREQPAGWFERSWPEEIADALATVTRELTKRYGKSPERWAWSQVRPMTLLHPFGDKKPLDALFNVNGVKSRGDATTVAQGAVDPRAPTANPIGVPTLRSVIDVGAWDEARFVLLGGQSGNPLSPQYADQVPLWERGETLPVYWSEDRIAEAARLTLTLEPEPEA